MSPPFDRFRRSTSLLVSLTLHVILLVVLALITRIEHVKDGLWLRATVSDESGQASFSLVDVSIEPSLVGDSELDAYEPTPLFTSQSLARIASPEANDRGSTTPSDADVSLAASVINADAAEGQTDGVTFFGTRAYGTRFVYVLDISGSMLARGGRRMDRAREELIRSINELQPHHSFYVVFYNDRAFNIFGYYAEMALATDEQQAAAATLIKAVRPWGGTMPAAALRIAGSLDPDAVFLLSDGDFAFDYKDPSRFGRPQNGRRLMQFVRAGPFMIRPQKVDWSSSPKTVLGGYDPSIVVHTIAFENLGSQRLMKAIANDKGGQYRFVPAPEEKLIRRR